MFCLEEVNLKNTLSQVINNEASLFQTPDKFPGYGFTENGYIFSG